MSPGFRFKQFIVADDRCTMKVGTDAVLLSAWVEVNGATTTILDIGSGSGVIGLMLAQRSQPDSVIHGVEIGAADAQQSKENIALSPWREKIHVHHTSIQQFQFDVQFDLIVTNPPFFNRSLLPPSVARTTARHTNDLSHEELLLHIDRLLSMSGQFAIILPTVEGNQFQELALRSGFHCVRRLAFFTRAHKPQERWLFTFSRLRQPCVEERLVLYGDETNWTREYRNLTSEFYLD